MDEVVRTNGEQVSYLPATGDRGVPATGADGDGAVAVTVNAGGHVAALWLHASTSTTEATAIPTTEATAIPTATCSRSTGRDSRQGDICPQVTPCAHHGTGAAAALGQVFEFGVGDKAANDLSFLDSTTGKRWWLNLELYGPNTCGTHAGPLVVFAEYVKKMPSSWCAGTAPFPAWYFLFSYHISVYMR